MTSIHDWMTSFCLSFTHLDCGGCCCGVLPLDDVEDDGVPEAWL